MVEDEVVRDWVGRVELEVDLRAGGGGGAGFWREEEKGARWT
jgi:hypothetical protein